ncbi:helix-turn-helix domain-containing protein [Vibrio europaeus]|uniref:helix-turn-helix domain-containing protein n=1 Tax=Vibrio europaeus TaxID=300876 RepID=UPI003AA9409B
MSLEKAMAFKTLFIELTDRQYQVLYLHSYGLGVKEIARFLKITERTTKFHLTDLRRIFDCHSSNELRLIYMSRLNTILASYICNELPVRKGQ